MQMVVNSVKLISGHHHQHRFPSLPIVCAVQPHSPCLLSGLLQCPPLQLTAHSQPDPDTYISRSAK